MFRILRIAVVVGTLAYLSPTHGDGTGPPTFVPHGSEWSLRGAAHSLGIGQGFDGLPQSAGGSSLGADLAGKAARTIVDRFVAHAVQPPERRPSADTLAAADRNAGPHRATR